jgi:hypothetical protein
MTQKIREESAMKSIMGKKSALLFVLLSFTLAAGVQAQKKAAEPAEETEDPAGEAEESVEEGSDESAPAPSGDELSEAEIIQKAGAYSVKLRDLEQKVNQLKEKIFRSKARLSLLAEKVLAGPAGAGARATITYSDKMGSSFKLIKAVFILDGVPIYNKADQKGMKKKKSALQLFSAPIVPGEHTLSVSLEYKGNGYGVFAYLNDYRFKVRSSHAFSVDEGKSKQLEIVIYERGNIATPLEERPAIKYVEQAGEFSE